MPSINNVILAGNLTKDPEFRQAGRQQVAVLSVAINRNYKRGDQWEQETTFVDVEAWDFAADAASKCGKGCPVLIEGRLKQDQWQDKQSGQTRSKMKVVASKIQSCRDQQAGNQQPRPQGPPQGYQPQLPQQPSGYAPQPPRPQQQQPQQPQGGYVPPPPPPAPPSPAAPQFPTQDVGPEQTDDIPF